MQNETWLADCVEDFLRDAAMMGVTDWTVLLGEKQSDQLETMVEDMFSYEMNRSWEDRTKAEAREQSERYGLELYNWEDRTDPEEYGL